MGKFFRSRFFIVMTEGGETHVLSAVIADEHQINSRHATAACCIYGFARWHAQEEACIWTTDKTILIETSFVRDLLHGSTRLYDVQSSIIYEKQRFRLISCPWKNCSRRISPSLRMYGCVSSYIKKMTLILRKSGSQQPMQNYH